MKRFFLLCALCLPLRAVDAQRPYLPLSDPTALHGVAEGSTSAIADPDAADENGITPLMRAAKDGNDWLIRQLLQSGADIQKRDKEGWSAFMYAVRFQNDTQIVRLLADSGAHVRIRNKYNTTPLMVAASYSQNPDIVAFLLRNRTASEDEVFHAFILAVMSAEGNEYVQQAKLQLFYDLGVPINRLWKDRTALMYACQYASSTAVIRQLLLQGADASVKDANGRTAFDYATRNVNLAHDDVYWSLNAARR